ncbi:MAG: uncharacterized protein JWO64_2517 [Hyphomicrobiales bacterium]|jgi:hypothetical protein|nr:uncharacterized protein [Hyphomicrobiales bacterium]
MNLFWKVAATALAGAALGLGATALTVARGFGFDVVQAGPWRAMPQVPASGGDPYARANVARSGRAPLGSAEGLGFTAVVDSAGAKLNASCDYRIAGAMPSARFWTLTVTDTKGHLVVGEGPAPRAGFTSSEILRDARGDFEIRLAREARPGNWLPLAAPGSFTLALRLYDSPHSLSAGALDANEMPEITRERCS